VTYANIANGGPLSVFGVSANLAGVHVDISATSSSNAVLRESGGTLGFGTLALGALGANSVSRANLVQGAALSVIGNATGGTANDADIVATSGTGFVLRENGGALGFGTITSSGIASGAVGSTQIANNAVGNAQLRTSAALSVIGRSVNSTGNVADISTTSGSGAVLQENSGTLVFQTYTAVANSVTYGQIQQGVGLSVLGVAGNATANHADIVGTANQALVVNAGGTSLGFGTVAVAGGGTGSTSAAGALTNLGAVAKAGDTMTGNLSINPASGGALVVQPVAGAASVYLRKAASGQVNQVVGQTGSGAAGIRWNIVVGDGTAEGGSNTGSNFAIQRYDDTGTLIDTPQLIFRNNGATQISNQLFIAGAASGAPAIVINNAAGVNRTLMWQTAGLTRWQWNVNSVAESGGNAGSDFALGRFTDAGAFIDQPISVVRSTGAVSFSQPVATLAALLPIGLGPLPWPTATAPAGWLLCGGQAVSRTTYSALFAVLSTTYGVGDGSTTFNLPDMRGRVPVGLDSLGPLGAAGRMTGAASGGFNATAIATAGGEQSHVDTVAEMPSHQHVTRAQTTAQTNNPGASNWLLSLQGAGGGNASGATDFNGSGSAHNNVQPGITVGYIIFAGV